MSDLLDVEKYFRWNPVTAKYDAQTWMRGVLPGWLSFWVNDQAYPFQIPASGTPCKPLHIQPVYGSAQGADNGLGEPFDIRRIVFADSTATAAASDVSLRMRDLALGRDLMNRPIHIRNLAGTAQLPFRMLEPYFMRSGSSLTLDFTKNSGGAVWFRFYFGGARYYAWAPGMQSGDAEKVKSAIRKRLNRQNYITPYWLTIDESDSLVLAGNASATRYAKNGEDGHFEAFAMMAVSTGAFSLQISEVITKQTIANGYFNSENGIGTAKLPFFFSAPLMIPGGMRLRLDFTDLSSSSNTIYFAFYGRRIYAPFKDDPRIDRASVVQTPADQGAIQVPAPLSYG
jgi:hypothetical protein